MLTVALPASTPLTERATSPLADLIRRLQDGDATALEPLIAQTQGLAYRLAYSLVRDRELCQDILQEVYWTVYREIRSLRDPNAFRTWFARILTNRCRRALRRKRPDSLDTLAESGFEPAQEGHERAAAHQADLRQALGQLSVTDRTVLVLREVMQLSYQEIASALELRLGTVKSRLCEARRRLLAVMTKGDSHGNDL